MKAPADRSILQPSQRVFTTWTPALIRAAFTQAEAGNVRLAAELCDNMLADDRINTVYETRIGGLLGLPIEFEASGDGRRKNKAVRALEAGEDWWEAFPEAELWPLLVWGRHFGISFGQLHPTEHEGRFVPRLEFWHPRNTRYDWGKRQWFARTDAGTTEVLITPGDGQWIAYAPYGNYRPWASGLWRGLARWWLLKSFAQDDSGRRSEKSGLTVVETTPQALELQPPEARQIRKEIAQDMAAAARDAVIVLPAGFSASLLESKDSIQQNQGVIIDMANTAIAIAVLGQNLTTEVKGGSYAAAAVHSKVEIQRIRADGETASTMLHDQALEWWAEFNFGSKSLAPWPIWRTDPPTDQVARATVLSTLATALSALKTAGYKIDVEQIETDFDVKLEELPEPEPPATPAPAGDPNAPPAPELGPDGKPIEPPPAAAPPAAKRAAPAARAGKKKLSRADRYERSPRPPDGAISGYTRACRELVAKWWAKIGPAALAKAKQIAEPDESRSAPDEGSDALLDYAELADGVAFASEVTAAAKAVGKHSDAEFKRLGIKLSKSDKGVAKLVPKFRKENVSLVGDMLREEHDVLEELLAEGAGRTIASLAADIEERLGITLRHAELIATDQCLKLNANVSHERMRQAGITEFVWSTAGDERVREMHEALDGETFSFDDPPITNEDGETNLPGEDIQCRCVAFPIVEALSDEEDADAAAE